MIQGKHIAHELTNSNLDFQWLQFLYVFFFFFYVLKFFGGI